MKTSLAIVLATIALTFGAMLSFTSDSGHSSVQEGCPLSAMRRHRRNTQPRRYRQPDAERSAMGPSSGLASCRASTLTASSLYPPRCRVSEDAPRIQRPREPSEGTNQLDDGCIPDSALPQPLTRVAAPEK